MACECVFTNSADFMGIGVYPSMFFISDVKIKFGEGTKENPYILIKKEV